MFAAWATTATGAAVAADIVEDARAAPAWLYTSPRTRAPLCRRLVDELDTLWLTTSKPSTKRAHVAIDKH